MNAIAGRYVAYRTAGSRGVFAVLIDVDEDRGEEALDYLGSVLPGQTTHVAMVRLGGDPENENAVVHGVYTAARTVKERQALSITIEIPAERQVSTNKTLGMPTSKRSIDVVLAVLHEEAVLKELNKAQRKDVATMSIQRCGILCDDPSFQRFVLRRGFVEGDRAGNEAMTTATVRRELGVESRREFRTDPEKLAAWHAYYRRYEDWLQEGRLPGEG